MEHDQAARLRALMRQVRLVAAVDAGPPRLSIVSLEGMAPHDDTSSFADALVAAAANEGVRLGPDELAAQCDWVYSPVMGPEARVDEALLERSSVVLALSEPTPSAVLATYALLKQLHVQTGPVAVEVVFAGEADECQRAADGLRGTCERFLGWRTLEISRWENSGDISGLEALVGRLSEQLAVANPRKSARQNSLAAEPCEPV